MTKQPAPLPAVVQIGPLPFAVVCDKAAMDAASTEAGESLRGETDHHTLQITLLPGMAPAKEAETLLHEVLHGCSSVVGIVDDLGEKEEEKMVARLAPALLAVLRSNRELVDYLLADQ